MSARLTRLLTLLFVAVLAAVAARSGWWNGGSAAWCIPVGMAAVHPAVLAVEFALARRLDAGPRVSWQRLLAAFGREWAESWMTFAWRMPWRAGALPDHLPLDGRGRRGVLLVHGFLCNRGFWNPWLRRLRALDQPYVAVDLEPLHGDIDAFAPALESAFDRLVRATGEPPLIVAHSMGGLAVRAWLRACPARAADIGPVFTLGTPHRGTWLARFALTRNARQMRPDSPWLAALAASEPAGLAARFVCWWSECDQIVFPAPTAVLAGAQARRLPGVAHIGLARHEAVWRELCGLLRPEARRVGSDRAPCSRTGP